MGVATNLALALAAALAGTGKRWRVAWVLAAVLCFVAVLPLDPPWSLLRSSAVGAELGAGSTVHFGVGRSATVTVRDQRGTWRLASNGLPEATIQPPGARSSLSAVGSWLGAAAMMARPDAKTMLMVGLGGGTALAHVPPGFESIDVIELEPRLGRDRTRVLWDMAAEAMGIVEDRIERHAIQ